MLIKNYNLGTFIEDLDVTIQNLILYMLKKNDFNIFLAYMIEYIWKIIQVKLAFMVRQLNYKVASDIVEANREKKWQFEEQAASYEEKISELN